MFSRLWWWSGHIQPEGHPGADLEHAEEVDIFQPVWEYIEIPQEQQLIGLEEWGPGYSAQCLAISRKGYLGVFIGLRNTSTTRFTANPDLFLLCYVTIINPDHTGKREVGIYLASISLWNQVKALFGKIIWWLFCAHFSLFLLKKGGNWKVLIPLPGHRTHELILDAACPVLLLFRGLGSAHFG